jgi:hypothetical protein
MLGIIIEQIHNLTGLNRRGTKYRTPRQQLLRLVLTCFGILTLISVFQWSRSTPHKRRRSPQVETIRGIVSDTRVALVDFHGWHDGESRA